MEQAVSKPKHDTRVLDDVKTKKIDQGQHYQLAVILNDGTLMKGDSKYTFVEILALIGIANATYDITARYSPNNIAKPKDVLGQQWGVYADSQEAAKALAVVFGYEKAPEVHDNWYYGHYHVVKGKNHILHIWYGQQIDYSLL